MKTVFAFCCFLLTCCLSQAQQSPSANKVCLSFLRDILDFALNGSNETLQERSGTTDSRVPPQVQCTCHPRDVEDLRSSLQNTEGKKVIKRRIACSGIIYFDIRTNAGLS